MELGWKDLVGNEEFSDVCFVTDGGKISAHRVVLAVKSRVFYAMFRNDFAENCSGEIEVKGVPRATMETFLTFLYTSSLDSCPAVAGDDAEAVAPVLVEVMRLAHRYGVQLVKGTQEDFFTKFIDERGLLAVETVLDFFQVARLLEMDALREMCLKFVVPVLDSVARHESCKRISSQDASFPAEFIVGTRRCLLDSVCFRHPSYVEINVVVSFMRNSEAVFESVEIDLWVQAATTVTDLARHLVKRLLMFQRYRRENVEVEGVTFFSSKFPPTALQPNTKLEGCHGWNGKRFTVLAKVGMS